MVQVLRHLRDQGIQARFDRDRFSVVYPQGEHLDVRALYERWRGLPADRAAAVVAGFLDGGGSQAPDADSGHHEPLTRPGRAGLPLPDGASGEVLDAFVERVVQGFRNIGETGARFDPTSFSLELSSGGVLPLQDLYIKCQTKSPGGVDNVIARYLAGLAGDGPAEFMPWDQARTTIRTVLRRCTDRARGESVAREVFPFVDEVLVVFDESEIAHAIGPEHLVRWNVSAEEAFAVGRGNLDPPPRSSLPESVGGLRLESGGMQSAMILVPGWLASLGPRPVAFVPDTYTLEILFDAGPDVIAERQREIQASYQIAARPVSPLAFTVDDSGAVVVLEHPEAAATLAETEYECQRSRLGDPEDPQAPEPAPFGIGGDGTTTAAIWMTGRSWMLPRADTVVLVSQEETFVVPFDDVVEIAGLRPVPDLHPVRYLAVEWPASSTLQRLRERAVLADVHAESDEPMDSVDVPMAESIPWPQARPLLRSILRPSTDPMGTEWVAREAFPFVDEVLVLDGEPVPGAVMDHHLAEWECSAAEAFDIARENLQRYARPVGNYAGAAADDGEPSLDEPTERHLLVVEFDNDYSASARLLVPGGLATLGPRPLVFMPDLRTLIQTGDTDPNRLHSYRNECVERYLGAARPVSPLGFTVDASGGVVVVDQPEAAAVLAQREYGRQRQWLDELLADDAPSAPASFQILGDHRTTVAVWPDQHAWMLPRADYVMFADESGAFFVRFDDVVDIAGLEPIPDLRPLRYAAQRWPNPWVLNHLRSLAVTRLGAGEQPDFSVFAVPR